VKQACTIEDVLERLNNLSEDQEGAHEEADMLLCDALYILGGDKVVTAFLNARRTIGFWYA
jgi:hypothetical protein